MMVLSSVRKLGFAGIATLLLVSGLTTSALTAQASDTPQAPTLIQAPALGSLSSLGGVSGYVASQSGGDTDSWLRAQGINPAAAGSITDTSLPAEARGKISISNGTASLASDAAGVSVGYLTGDATGKETVSADLSQVGVAPGHENDAYAMTSTEFLTWLNGTTWKGTFSLPDVSSFSITVAWSLSGAKVTVNPSTTLNLALAAQFQNGINNSIDAPGSLNLADVVAGVQDYSWGNSAVVPYSFAYSVGSALPPGSSVSVNLPDVVSGSWLDDLNIDNAQTSGVLSSIPLSAWLPGDSIGSLSQLDGFSDFTSLATTSDLVSLLVGDLMNGQTFNTWVSGVAVSSVQSALSTINSSGMGYTMQPLTSADQKTIQANTPAVMALFVQDGFPDLFAQGISATINVNANLDPGTLTSLIPTGVTYNTPIEVDTVSSALVLSDTTMTIDPGICTGGVSVTPDSLTATATVIDTTGAPVVGAEVSFAAESPLVIDEPIQTTDANGIATARVSLPGQSSPVPQVLARVSAHVDFGAGADLTAQYVDIEQLPAQTMEELPVLTIEPTLTLPVYANGTDSYTASVRFTDLCGLPQSGRIVQFSVTGSAQVAQSLVASDENGIASVTLTDEYVERVTVSATQEDGTPIAGPSTTLTFSSQPCTGDLCLAPIPASATLTIDASKISTGGTILATATVYDAVDQPITGSPVTFRIDGNAQFSDGSTSITTPTGANGQAAVTITTTDLDCDNLGFDVYAYTTAGSEVIDLTGSPARVTIVPPENVCDVAVAPPQVQVANATVINGTAVPGATVQVVGSAGAVLGSTQANVSGVWSIPTPAGTISQQITVNALNRTGEVVASSTAWLDTDAPAPARIDEATTRQVAGNVGAVESSSIVTIVFPDQTTITALANANGSYAVATPEGMPEGLATVTVTDQAGNVSIPVTVNLVTYVAPVSTVTVTVRNSQVQIGALQTVTGKGFRYLERVSAQLCSTTCVPVGNGFSGLTGQASISFFIPDDTAPGDYTVTLTGTTSGGGSAGFTVTVPDAPSPSGSLGAYLLSLIKWWWSYILNR